MNVAQSKPDENDIHMETVLCPLLFCIVPWPAATDVVGAAQNTASLIVPCIQNRAFQPFLHCVACAPETWIYYYYSLALRENTSFFFFYTSLVISLNVCFSSIGCCITNMCDRHVSPAADRWALRRGRAILGQGMVSVLKFCSYTIGEAKESDSGTCKSQ